MRLDLSDEGGLDSSGANSLSWDYVASPVELDRNHHQMSAAERAQRTRSFPLHGRGSCERSTFCALKIQRFLVLFDDDDGVLIAVVCLALSAVRISLHCVSVVTESHGEACSLPWCCCL